MLRTTKAPSHSGGGATRTGGWEGGDRPQQPRRLQSRVLPGTAWPTMFSLTITFCRAGARLVSDAQTTKPRRTGSGGTEWQCTIQIQDPRTRGKRRLASGERGAIPPPRPRPTRPLQETSLDPLASSSSSFSVPRGLRRGRRARTGASASETCTGARDASAHPISARRRYAAVQIYTNSQTTHSDSDLVQCLKAMLSGTEGLLVVGNYNAAQSLLNGALVVVEKLPPRERDEYAPRAIACFFGEGRGRGRAVAARQREGAEGCLGPKSLCTKNGPTRFSRW